MKNHDILFDKPNKRLGFVRSDCGRSGLFPPTPPPPTNPLPENRQGIDNPF